MNWIVPSLLSMHLWAAPGAFGGTSTEIEVQHEFSRGAPDGFESQAALLLASDGAFYGTALRGGAHGYGVVFKFSPNTKDYRVLHHFSSDRSDGKAPGGPLSEGKDGFLYGTTSLGGSSGLGTVFKVDKEGNGFAIVHSFTGVRSNGRVPFSGVRQGKDLFWFGTTDEGGIYGGGTLYRLNPDGTGHRLLHEFGGKLRGDGGIPRATLCLASDGKWYGATAFGGRDDWGTLFVLNGDGTGYRLLRAFVGAPQDVGRPYGTLIEAADGRLYGSSTVGGRGSQGTVFRLRKDGTGFEVLRHLTGLGGDGRNPHAGLVEGKDGTLYGVTLNGGSRASGLVFALAPDGTGYRTLFEFSDQGIEGRLPYAGLSLGPDGSLYGITSAGRTGHNGTLFRLRPGTN